MHGVFDAKRALSFFIALMAIFSLKPLIFVDYLPYVVKSSLIILVVLIAINAKKKYFEYKLNNIIFFSLVLIFFLCLSIFNDEIFNGISIFSFVFFIIIFVEISNLRLITLYFSNIYVLIVSLGIFMYILVMSGIIIDGNYQASNHSLKTMAGFYYINYYNFLLVLKNENYDFLSGYIRFQSIFDEPGVIGTISGLLLISTYKIKIKIKEVVYLITGILSLSLSFYVFLGIYLIIRKNYRTIIILLISLLLSYLWIVHSGNDAILDYLNNRISRGDNRISSCFMFNFNEYFYNNAIFGVGQNSTINTGCDVSSYLSYIYDYGVLFSAMIYISMCVFFYILYLKFNIKKTSIFILWCFIFTLNLYQRPVVYDPAFILISFLFFYNTLNFNLWGRDE